MELPDRPVNGGNTPTTQWRVKPENGFRVNSLFVNEATEMKQTQIRSNIATQIRVETRSNPLVSFLPIALIAALVTALALVG